MWRKQVISNWVSLIIHLILHPNILTAQVAVRALQLELYFSFGLCSVDYQESAIARLQRIDHNRNQDENHNFKSLQVVVLPLS